jgi:hypothetical protein
MWACRVMDEETVRVYHLRLFDDRLDLWRMQLGNYWREDMLLWRSIRNRTFGIQFVKLNWYAPGLI